MSVRDLKIRSRILMIVTGVIVGILVIGDTLRDEVAAFLAEIKTA